MAGALVAAVLSPRASWPVDFVPGPRPRETVVSAAGAYAFDIEVATRWRTEPATGTLYAVQGGQRRVVWQRALPQRVRPRYVLVADDGAVLLLDQFDNVKAPLAALLINPQGRDVATLSFDDVVRATGAAETDVLHQARHGAWIQTPPSIAGTDVQVGAAGQTLLIDMATGRLRRAQR